MLKLKQTVATLLFAATGAIAAAADDARSDIVVEAAGFPSAAGHAVAKLYQPGDNIVGPGRWQQATTITAGKASFRFVGLPPGPYAVVVFHDENDNGTVDHSWLRMPSEALGFSNGFVPGLIAGMPSFEKLQFTHGNDPQRIDIRVAKVSP